MLDIEANTSLITYFFAYNDIIALNFLDRFLNVKNFTVMFVNK